MTEKRYQYIRTKYRHYIQDMEKDGEWKESYRGTYDTFDLDKICELLNELHEEKELEHKRVNYLKKIVAENCPNSLLIQVQNDLEEIE